MVIIPRLSNHYSPRILDVTAIVIHKTESINVEGTLSWFLAKESGVSSHYVIDYDGIIYMVVPEDLVAWHAGKSILHGMGEVNQYSVGIELVGLSTEEIHEEQLEALIEICADSCYRHKIPLNRVVGHSHIATPMGRKTDPGIKFPWFEFLNTLGARITEKEITG